MKRKYLLPLLVLTLMMATACTTEEMPMATQMPTDMPATMAPTEMPTVEPIASPDTGAMNMDLKDGTYTAQMSEEYATTSGHGWQDFLTVTVSGGKIAQVEFDSKKDGKLKSEATPEEYNMTPLPSEWIPQLTENIKKAATPDEIDAVTGATTSSDIAKKLYAAVLDAARAGEMDVVTLNT